MPSPGKTMMNRKLATLLASRTETEYSDTRQEIEKKRE